MDAMDAISVGMQSIGTIQAEVKSTGVEAAPLRAIDKKTDAVATQQFQGMSSSADLTWESHTAKLGDQVPHMQEIIHSVNESVGLVDSSFGEATIAPSEHHIQVASDQLAAVGKSMGAIQASSPKPLSFKAIQNEREQVPANLFKHAAEGVVETASDFEQNLSPVNAGGSFGVGSIIWDDEVPAEVETQANEKPKEAVRKSVTSGDQLDQISQQRRGSESQGLRGQDAVFCENLALTSFLSQNDSSKDFATVQRDLENEFKNALAGADNLSSKATLKQQLVQLHSSREAFKSVTTDLMAQAVLTLVDDMRSEQGIKNTIDQPLDLSKISPNLSQEQIQSMRAQVKNQLDTKSLSSLNALQKGKVRGQLKELYYKSSGLALQESAKQVILLQEKVLKAREDLPKMVQNREESLAKAKNEMASSLANVAIANSERDSIKVRYQSASENLKQLEKSQGATPEAIKAAKEDFQLQESAYEGAVAKFEKAQKAVAKSQENVSKQNHDLEKAKKIVDVAIEELKAYVKGIDAESIYKASGKIAANMDVKTMVQLSCDVGDAKALKEFKEKQKAGKTEKTEAEVRKELYNNRKKIYAMNHMEMPEKVFGSKIVDSSDESPSKRNWFQKRK